MALVRVQRAADVEPRQPRERGDREDREQAQRPRAGSAGATGAPRRWRAVVTSARPSRAGRCGPWRSACGTPRAGAAASGRPAARSCDPGDVDRVVAVLHARRLEDVRDVPEAGVAEHAGEARRPDPSRADVLVAVRPRAQLRARVVEVDHPQPPEAERRVEAPRRRRRRPRRCRSRSRRPTGAPCRGSSRTARGRSPAAATASSIRASSSMRRAQPEPAAGAVLQDEGHVAPLVAGELRGPATRPSARRAMPASTPSPRCEPTWTLTYAAPYARATRSSCARTTTDLSMRPGSGPARLTRYGAWIDSGATPCSARRSRKAGSSPGSVGTAAPGRRVVAEHLDRGRADLGRPVGGPDHAGAEGEVGAEPPTVRKHRPKSSRGTPRPAP